MLYRVTVIGPAGAAETGEELAPMAPATEDAGDEPAATGVEVTKTVVEMVVWVVKTVLMTLGAVRTMVEPEAVMVSPTGQVVTVVWTTSVT